MATQFGSFKLHTTVASSRVGFDDLLASGRSSREGYTEIFAAQLATPSRVKLPVAKNTWQILLKLLAWSVLAGDPSDWLATCISREKHMSCVSKTVFKTFSAFPRNFYVYSLSLTTETNSNTLCHSLQTPLLLHFFSNLQEKGMGLLFLTSYFMFWVLFSWFLCCHCDLRYIVFEHVFA